MAISVNWITGVITIPKADTTLVQSTPTEIRELDLNQFRLVLRDLEEDPDGRPWPRTHDHNTEVTVSGIQLARVLTILEPYTITFEDGAYAVNLVNANSNVGDRVNVNQVSVRSANSAGLVNLRELRTISFIGKDGKGIAIATISGTDSTQYPYGSRENPCKTEQNLLDLEGEYGYRNVYVTESMQIIQDHSGNPNVWIGDNPQTVAITIGDSATYPNKNVTDSKFMDCYIQGELDTKNIIERCIVGPISNANGFIYESALQGPIVVSETVSVEECWISPNATSQEVEIDFNGLANTVIISDWSAGRVVCKNMVTGSFLGISGSGGRVVPDISNTGGTVVYAGAIAIDDTYAANLDILQNTTTAQQVWENATGVATSTKIALIEQILRNESFTDPVTGEYVILNDAGDAELYRIPVWENVAKSIPYSGNVINRRERIE